MSNWATGLMPTIADNNRQPNDIVGTAGMEQVHAVTARATVPWVYRPRPRLLAEQAL